MPVVSMSKKEFDRLEVLLGVRSGRLRVADTCELLGLKRRQVFRLLAHLVAWIGGTGALSPTCVPGYAMRTYFGRPSSSIRFSTSTAMAMCGRPPRCKEKMEDQQLGQVWSCVRPRTMRYA